MAAELAIRLQTDDALHNVDIMRTQVFGSFLRVIVASIEHLVCGAIIEHRVVCGARVAPSIVSVTSSATAAVDPLSSSQLESWRAASTPSCSRAAFSLPLEVDAERQAASEQGRPLCDDCRAQKYASQASAEAWGHLVGGRAPQARHYFRGAVRKV